MIRYLNFILAAVLAVAATACAAAPVDRCLKAKDVLQCQQVVKAGGSAEDYLLYGMTGYMLGTVMRGGQRQTVIIADPHYRGYRPAIASYQHPAMRKQTVTTTTTVRNGSAVTSTVKTKTWSSGSSGYRSTYSYRPTYSSRLSFRSGK
jgi:uncharacterized protein YgiB involved in biofilm formation